VWQEYFYHLTGRGDTGRPRKSRQNNFFSLGMCRESTLELDEEEDKEEEEEEEGGGGGEGGGEE
jgi:hypothetical protein